MNAEDRAKVAAALRPLAPIDEASLARAVDDFSLRVLQPGDHLLRVGDVAQRFGLIDTGLMREYYVSSAGDEQVRNFCFEGQLTGSLYDLLTQAPALSGIQALEPTRLFVSTWSAFEARCEREPVWHQVGRRVAEGLYKLKAVREHQMLALTAAERWAAIDPRLVARVSGRHLASYLGITPEHLSRIRGSARAASTRSSRSRKPRSRA